jgi:hypothetical protein
MHDICPGLNAKMQIAMACTKPDKPGLRAPRRVPIGGGDVCDVEPLRSVVGQQIRWKRLVPQELPFVEKADDRSNA